MFLLTTFFPPAFFHKLRYPCQKGAAEFLLPVAGFLTDKAGVSRTLTGGTGILGILLVSLAVVNQVNAVNKYTVFIYAVLFGGISAAILPALYSAVPALVSGGNLQKANRSEEHTSELQSPS